MNWFKQFEKPYFEGELSNYRGYLRDHRFPLVAIHLTGVFELRGERVLDVGSAIPYLCDELWKLGVEAYSCDISRYVMRKAIEEGLHGWHTLCNAINLPYRDKSFYLVIASELVEHIPHEYEDQLLKELTRVTRKYLLIRTPFWNNPLDKDVTHINIHPHMYWITKIEELGFIHDDDLYEEYAYRGHNLFKYFFDEFLVFKKLKRHFQK